MVEHKLGVCVMKFAGDPPEGNSEEADSIVARRFPKHRKDPWHGDVMLYHSIETDMGRLLLLFTLLNPLHTSPRS